MSRYELNERGQFYVNVGRPLTPLSPMEVCNRLAERDKLVKELASADRKLLKAEVAAKERLSAYKKSIQPCLDDADRFLALATAFVTQDPQFTALCDNPQLQPTTVDQVRHGVDLARGKLLTTTSYCRGRNE